MELTELEKKIIEEALYELLYNVKKEENQIKKLENDNIKDILKFYKFNSEDVRNLIKKL